jgi:hypothetical protein
LKRTARVAGLLSAVPLAARVEGTITYHGVNLVEVSPPFKGELRGGEALQGLVPGLARLTIEALNGGRYEGKVAFKVVVVGVAGDDEATVVEVRSSWG